MNPERQRGAGPSVISIWQLHRRTTILKILAVGPVVLSASMYLLYLGPTYVVQVLAGLLWALVLMSTVLIIMFAGALAYLGPSSGWPGSWSLAADVERDRLVAVVAAVLAERGIPWERREPEQRPRFFRRFEMPFVLGDGAARIWVAEITPPGVNPPSPGGSKVQIEPTDPGFDSEWLRTQILQRLMSGKERGEPGSWLTYDELTQLDKQRRRRRG